LDLLGDIIELFKEDSVRQIAAIREAIGKKEAALVKRAAHTLRGTCGNLGAVEAAAITLDLEKLVAGGDFSRAEDKLRSLEVQIERVGKLLDELRHECVR